MPSPRIPSTALFFAPSPSPSALSQDDTHTSPSPSPSPSPVSLDSSPKSSPSPSPHLQQALPSVSSPIASRWPKLTPALPWKSPPASPPPLPVPPTSPPAAPALPLPVPPLQWHNPATAAKVFPSARNPSSSSTFPLAAVTGATAAFVVALAVGLALLWSLRNRARSNQGRRNGDSDLSKSSKANLHRVDALMSGSSNASPAFSGKKVVAATETPVLSPAASWIWRYMFDYGELADATDGFASRNLIGEGGFGFVYKGRLPDGKEVAVKRLKQTGSPRAERQFQAEVEIISRVHHRNLVSLLGYCICKDQRLLIYEFVPNGTLEQHLHELHTHTVVKLNIKVATNPKPSYIPGILYAYTGLQMPELLNWERRMNIAVGAARGLAYLHQDCHPPIIHCDVKSSNILLDQKFNPKVSDFGLAILLSDPYAHVTSHVVGTLGYLAPDYPLSGKLTDKSDVYSFGVLLLEIVTGKKPIDRARDSDYGSLLEWGQPLLERVLEERDMTIMLDPRLQNGSRCNEDEVLRVLEVAASCLNPSPKCRPRMAQVVRVLEKEDRSSLQHPHSADGAADGEQKEADATNQLALAKVFRMMACADHHHLIDHTGVCSIDFSATTFFSKSSSAQ